MSNYLDYLDTVYDELVDEYGSEATLAYHQANEKEM
jgi:hypothetical protein